MQTRNPVLNGVARAVTEAAGMADGVRREAETLAHSQLQRLLADADLVTREEFEAVQDLATKALAEVTALREEIAQLKASD